MGSQKTNYGHLFFYEKKTKKSIMNNHLQTSESPSILFNSKKRIAQIPLSETCKSVLLGSLLGDGSLKINKNYVNARFSCRHSITQTDYFDWKVSVLNEILGKKPVHLQPPDGDSKNPKLRLQSRALPSLTSLHSVVCVKNKLHIRRHWLNHLTALSLAVWWLDEGSLIGGARRGVLCTDGFDEKSIKILSSYLEKVWGVKTRVGPTQTPTGKKYRLWLNTSQLKIFLKIVLPYIPVSSMIKKVVLKYKDPKLQQRWISTVKKSLPKEIQNNVPNNC